MNEIKQRKQLTKITLYDWDPVITEIEKKDIDKSLNSDWKFLIFGDRTLNKSNIKEISAFKSSEIDNYVLSQPKEIKELLQKKVKERKAEWKRINIEILKNIVESRKDV